MQLVIEISEDTFFDLKKKQNRTEVDNAILNGKPLPQGHWISHREHCEMNNLRPSALGSYFWCSECDCGIDSKNFSKVNYNYCPNCGADMSEVEE